jgi:hypothetical protein
VVRRTTRRVDGKRRSVWVTDTPAFDVADDGTVTIRDTGEVAGRVEHRSGIPNSYSRSGEVDGWCIVGKSHEYSLACDAEWSAAHVAEDYAKAHPRF